MNNCHSDETRAQKQNQTGCWLGNVIIGISYCGNTGWWGKWRTLDAVGSRALFYWTIDWGIKTGIFLTVHTRRQEYEILRLSKRYSWGLRYVGFCYWCPSIRNCQVALSSKIGNSDVPWTFRPLNTRPPRCIETSSSDTVLHSRKSKTSRIVWDYKSVDFWNVLGCSTVKYSVEKILYPSFGKKLISYIPWCGMSVTFSHFK